MRFINLKTSNQIQIPGLRLRRIATLIGFYPEIEAAKLLLSQNLIDLPDTLEAIHTLWEKSAEKRKQLPPRKLNPSLQSTLQLEQFEKKLKAWPIYQYAFGNVNFQLLMIPLDELIPVQWYLDLDYCNKLINQVPKPETSTIEDLLHYLYKEKIYWPRPTYDHSNGCRSLKIPEITPNMDVRFIKIDSRTNDPITHEATIRIQPSFNYLHVAQIRRYRLVIMNGGHHACALYQVGWTRIPCLVRKANNLAEIGFPPDQLGVIPEDQVLNSGHPPSLSDYFDEMVAPRFDQYVIDQTTLQLQPITTPTCKPPA